jgi:hypothetical protein
MKKQVLAALLALTMAINSTLSGTDSSVVAFEDVPNTAIQAVPSLIPQHASRTALITVGVNQRAELHVPDDFTGYGYYREVLIDDFEFRVTEKRNDSETVTHHTIQATGYESYIGYEKGLALDSKLSSISFPFEFPENTTGRDVIYIISVEYEGETVSTEVTVQGTANTLQRVPLSVEINEDKWTIKIEFDPYSDYQLDVSISPEPIYESPYHQSPISVGPGYRSIPFYLPANRTNETIVYTITVTLGDETASATVEVLPISRFCSECGIFDCIRCFFTGLGVWFCPHCDESGFTSACWQANRCMADESSSDTTDELSNTTDEPNDTTDVKSEEPAFIIGHVLGNEKIGVGDALAILRYLVGLSSPIATNSESRAAANITTPGLGEPTVKDALAILRYCVGLPSALD